MGRDVWLEPDSIALAYLKRTESEPCFSGEMGACSAPVDLRPPRAMTRPLRPAEEPVREATQGAPQTGPVTNPASTAPATVEVPFALAPRPEAVDRGLRVALEALRSPDPRGEAAGATEALASEVLRHVLNWFGSVRREELREFRRRVRGLLAHDDQLIDTLVDVTPLQRFAVLVDFLPVLIETYLSTDNLPRFQAFFTPRRKAWIPVLEAIVNCPHPLSAADLAGAGELRSLGRAPFFRTPQAAGHALLAMATEGLLVEDESASAKAAHYRATPTGRDAAARFAAEREREANVQRALYAASDMGSAKRGARHPAPDVGGEQRGDAAPAAGGGGMVHGTDPGAVANADARSSRFGDAVLEATYAHP